MACFLHATFWHYFFNALFMAYFMSVIEKSLGAIYTLILFLLSGFCGNMISSAITSTPLRISIGASTGLFGVMAYLSGYFVLNYHAFNKPSLQSMRKGLIAVTVIVTALILFIGISTDTNSVIDGSGHFGGFLIGLFLSVGVPKTVVNPVTTYEERVRKIGLIGFGGITGIFFIVFLCRKF